MPRKARAHLRTVSFCDGPRYSLFATTYFRYRRLFWQHVPLLLPTSPTQHSTARISSLSAFPYSLRAFSTAFACPRSLPTSPQPSRVPVAFAAPQRISQSEPKEALYDFDGAGPYTGFCFCIGVVYLPRVILSATVHRTLFRSTREHIPARRALFSRPRNGN